MADTLTVIDRARPGETWTAAIARRLREQFNAHGLSMSKAAQLAGISQSQFSRRMTGQLPFAIDELELVCAVCGIDRDFVLTGALSLPGNGEESLLGVGGATAKQSIRRRSLPRLDSNQQPFGEYLGSCLPAAIAI